MAPTYFANSSLVPLCISQWLLEHYFSWPSWPLANPLQCLHKTQRQKELTLTPLMIVSPSHSQLHLLHILRCCTLPRYSKLNIYFTFRFPFAPAVFEGFLSSLNDTWHEIKHHDKFFFNKRKSPPPPTSTATGTIEKPVLGRRLSAKVVPTGALTGATGPIVKPSKVEKIIEKKEEAKKDVTTFFQDVSKTFFLYLSVILVISCYFVMVYLFICTLLCFSSLFF